MNIKRDSYRDLLKFYNVYGKKIVDWLECKATIFKNDLDSIDLLNNYKKKKQRSIILIVIVFMSFLGPLIISLNISNYILLIASFLFLFFFSIPSFVFASKFSYDGINLFSIFFSGSKK